MVDTAERKKEIQDALRPLIVNPAVTVNIQTVAEALEAQQRSGGMRIYQFDGEMMKGYIPVYAELFRYFSVQLGGTPSLAERESKAAWIDAQIRELSDRLTKGSMEAKRHAEIIRDLANRFSSDDVREMKPEIRATWRAMMHDHARTVEQECRQIRLDLRTIFFPDSPLDQLNQSAEVGIDQITGIEETELVPVAGQLFTLATAHNTAMLLAFTVSGEDSVVETTALQKLWPSLILAEKLASRVGKI
jgi:uncharacterized coiled-coil protein SlyX